MPDAQLQNGEDAAHWDALRRALDILGDAGGRLSLWWRDDDAAEGTDALKKLAECAGAAPVQVAVVPAWLKPDLPAAVQAFSQVDILQHGFAHQNLGRDGEKKSEFPPSRTKDTQSRKRILEELYDGKLLLSDAFGDRFRPIMVPPWNRITPELTEVLPDAGFEGLSTYLEIDKHLHSLESTKSEGQPLAEFRRIETHIDILDWRGTRGFVGVEYAVGALTRAADHAAAAYAAEDRPTADMGPIGILSHHLVHDADCWDYLGRLANLAATHEALEWVRPFARKPMAADEVAATEINGGAGVK